MKRLDEWTVFACLCESTLGGEPEWVNKNPTDPRNAIPDCNTCPLNLRLFQLSRGCESVER